MSFQNQISLNTKGHGDMPRRCQAAKHGSPAPEFYRERAGPRCLYYPAHKREERPTRHPNDSSGYVPVVELDFLRGVITCQQPSMAGALARESLPHFSLMRGIAS